MIFRQETWKTENPQADIFYARKWIDFIVKSKLSMVALSLTEVEYVATAQDMEEMLWLWQLMKYIGFKCMILKILFETIKVALYLH